MSREKNVYPQTQQDLQIIADCFKNVTKYKYRYCTKILLNYRYNYFYKFVFDYSYRYFYK